MYKALEEVLGEELLKFVTFREPFGEILDSPFVIETNLNLITAANARKEYEKKKELAELERTRWDGSNADNILRHYLPNHRIKGYYDTVMPNKVPTTGIHINILCSIWLQQTQVHKYHKEWNELFRKDIPGAQYGKDPVGIALDVTESRNLYNSSRDLLNVYRGQETITEENRGLAWTTSKEKAEEFASRCKNGMVASLTVHKDAVYTFLSREDYIEIILLDPAYAPVRRPHLMLNPESVKKVPVNKGYSLTAEDLEEMLKGASDNKIELENQDPRVLNVNLDTGTIDSRASSERVGFVDVSGRETQANVVADDEFKEWIEDLASENGSLFNNVDMQTSISFLAKLMGGFTPGVRKTEPERKDPSP